MITHKDSEKLERKFMRMFEYHFRNYKLDFTKGEIAPYLIGATYMMFLAYQAGYLKGRKIQ